MSSLNDSSPFDVKNFSDRLSATASLGLYATDIDDFDASVVGAAQAGLRYSF